MSGIRTRILLFHEARIAARGIEPEKKEKLLTKIMAGHEAAGVFDPPDFSTTEDDETVDVDFMTSDERILNKQIELSEKCPGLGITIGIPKRKHDPNVTRFGRSIVHEAVLLDDLDLLKQLINNGEDIHRTDNNGHTPLQIAIMEEKDEIVMYLASLNK